MEALLFLLIFMISAALIIISRLASNAGIFKIAAGILLVFLSLMLAVEGLSFPQTISSTTLRNYEYNATDSFQPVNSSMSISYSNITRNDIYVDGLATVLFLLGISVAYEGVTG